MPYDYKLYIIFHKHLLIILININIEGRYIKKNEQLHFTTPLTFFDFFCFVTCIIYYGVQNDGEKKISENL